MALWLALDQVSETERVARQAGRLRPTMGQVAAPLFSTLPELVVSDLGLDGNAHSGQAASCRALDFTRRPLRRIPSLVEPSIQTCSRYKGGVLLRTEECLMIPLYADSGLESV